MAENVLVTSCLKTLAKIRNLLPIHPSDIAFSEQITLLLEKYVNENPKAVTERERFSVSVPSFEEFMSDFVALRTFLLTHEENISAEFSGIFENSLETLTAKHAPLEIANSVDTLVQQLGSPSLRTFLEAEDSSENILFLEEATAFLQSIQAKETLDKAAQEQLKFIQQQYIKEGYVSVFAPSAAKPINIDSSLRRELMVLTPSSSVAEVTEKLNNAIQVIVALSTKDTLPRFQAQVKKSREAFTKANNAAVNAAQQQLLQAVSTGNITRETLDALLKQGASFNHVYSDYKRSPLALLKDSIRGRGAQRDIIDIAELWYGENAAITQQLKEKAIRIEGPEKNSFADTVIALMAQHKPSHQPHLSDLLPQQTRKGILHAQKLLQDKVEPEAAHEDLDPAQDNNRDGPKKP